jgi:hypothetical protein
MSISLKEIQSLLFCRVAHPEMLGPHLDLRLVKPGLLDNRLHILRGKHEAMGRAGEHDPLQAGDAGVLEAWHVTRVTTRRCWNG